MAELFVCVPKDGSVSPDRVRAVGAAGVRFTADRHFDQARYARSLHDAGLKAFVTIDSDSLIGFRDRREMAEYFANTFVGYIVALGGGNESDGTGSESWRQSLDDVHDLLRHLRASFPRSCPIIGPGLVSGQPDYLDRFDLSLVDGVDLHLYGKRPPDWPVSDGGTGRLSVALDAYRQKLRELGFGHLRIYMTEIGLSSDEMGEQGQAEYCGQTMTYLGSHEDVVLAAWFAFHNWTGFGLVRDDGIPKPSYQAFQRAAGGPRESESIWKRRALETAAWVRQTPLRKITKRELLRRLEDAA